MEKVRKLVIRYKIANWLEERLSNRKQKVDWYNKWDFCVFQETASYL